MRTRLKRITGWGVLLAVGLGGTIASAAGKGGVLGLTVGDLAIRLAGAAELELAPSNGPAASAEALRALGVAIGSDLGRVLTEGDLVTIGRSIGVPVESSLPGRAVGRARSATFVRAVESILQRARSGGMTTEKKDKDDDARPSCTGRARRHANRKGHPASPASPNATAGPCGSGNP